jgi:hypothetical protein
LTFKLLGCDPKIKPGTGRGRTRRSVSGAGLPDRGEATPRLLRELVVVSWSKVAEAVGILAVPVRWGT